MPTVRRKPDPVVAICISDLHISLRPPKARASEPDWMKAMGRMLRQVKELASKHEAVVLCAGDIFNQWNAPAEIINWALENLPHMYGIPGNHDLPTHRQELSHKSAYGTLVRAGRITEITKPKGVGRMMLYGRVFGEKTPKRIQHPSDVFGQLHVLLTHEYLWSGDHRYQGAPEDQRLGKSSKRFREFDVVVVGDNHKGFLRNLKSGTKVLNCGRLIRRNSDEEDYTPHLGLIHQSGRVTRHPLSLTGDKITKTLPREEPVENEAVSKFLRKLAKMESVDLDFKLTVFKAMDKAKVRSEVRDILKEAINE